MTIFQRQIRPTDSKVLWAGFYQSALEFPTRPALEVGGQRFTYEQLLARVTSLAATLMKHYPAAEPPLTAILAYRSVTAFAGVLAALFRGHGYVPLNRTFPPERSRLMLQKSGCNTVIVDSASERQLDGILAGAKDKLLLVFPERTDVSDLAGRFRQHQVLGGMDLELAGTWFPPPNVPADTIAYLLFTSGSTGIPKGVMVSHRNVRHYVNWAVERYQVFPEDRVSQTFDMTFDLSAHDMFVAWERGACVCCPSQKQLIKPNAFIKDSRLTVWFSVPSTAVFMRRLGLLKAGMYPSLRLSLFCGEALPAETVQQWALAAPNSLIENIYGPTELTIACTAYRWDARASDADCENGIVPIGEPFPGMEALVADEQLREVEPGTDGELLMTGPQLSLGYWQDKEKTDRAFVVVPGRDVIYYRTGDRVRRPLDGKPMIYLGRMDQQIKILGHRVELGEVEAAVRNALGVDGVVAIGWPKTSSGADGIEVFVQTDAIEARQLLETLKSRLPLYMVPRNIHALPRFPLNANGKFDRKALIHILEQNA